MEFFYRYYYHFYRLHRRDHLTGINKNIPWFSALSQIAFGTLCFVLGLYWLMTWLSGITSNTGGVQKYHVLLLLPICFAAWYYLLFKQLRVDKLSGKTDLYSTTLNNEKGFLYWIIWIGSVLFPFAVAVLRKV